jgi:hypothetical protein
MSLPDKEAAERALTFSQILQCFEIVDYVRHGSPYAFARTDRRQVRDFFASANRQGEGPFSYPCLLNLDVVRPGRQ